MKQLVEASNIANTKDRTDKVKSMSDDIDASVRLLRGFANLMEKSDDEKFQQAAQIISSAFSKQPTLLYGGYETKAGRVKIFIEGIKEVDPETMASAGFPSLISSLEEKVSEFDNLYIERNAYRESIKAKVEKARAEMDEAFRPLWNYIVAMVAFDSSYQKIVDRFNEFCIWNIKPAEVADIQEQPTEDSSAESANNDAQEEGDNMQA